MMSEKYLYHYNNVYYGVIMTDYEEMGANIGRQSVRMGAKGYRKGMDLGRRGIGRLDSSSANLLPRLDAKCESGKPGSVLACRLAANIRAGRIRGRQAREAFQMISSKMDKKEESVEYEE